MMDLMTALFANSFTNSLGLVLLGGMIMHWLFLLIKMPGLLGMLILGIALGPYGIDALNPELLKVSPDLRLIALIVILLRAGIGINKEDLKAVGRPALRLSFIPGVLEGLAIAAAATVLLDFTPLQGGMLGFIIAAVSPAVVVPAMLHYMEAGLGKAKRIPTMILAGASVDDVVAITLFSACMGMATGGTVHWGFKLLSIPASIVLGLLIGGLCGIVLVRLFKRHHIRDTKKVLILLSVAIGLTAVEKGLKAHVEIAGLIGVMAIGFILLEFLPAASKRLAEKLNKIWIFAEILLFVLVGAQVNIGVGLEAGASGLALIACGLIARSLGVWISLLRTELNAREKLFCIIAYWPKATVQAAIGAIPLSAGIQGGDLILAIAVLSILVTAPLGAVGIQISAPHCLES